MNCIVGFVSCFCEFPGLPLQHGTRQQGWFTSGTLRKEFSNLTALFILSLGRMLISKRTGKEEYTSSLGQRRAKMNNLVHLSPLI